MREKKIFLHILLFQCITLYEKRQKITPLNTIEFFDTHACINNPHSEGSGIIIFLRKYYIVISDALGGSFLDAFFLLLAVILSELYGKPRRNKDSVTENITQKNLCEGHHHFYDCPSPFLCHLLFSLWIPSPNPSDALAD